MSDHHILAARRGFMRKAAGASALAAWGPAMAQFRVEVSGIGVSQLPIALPVFKGEATAPQKISAIVRADLERSGVFRSADAAGMAADESTRLDPTVWRQRGADFMAAGSISPLADGRFDVRVRLWDVVRAQDLGGQSFAVNAAELRLVAHRIADFLYEKLTGEKGVFATRIAYVTRAAQRYQLWVADSDGESGIEQPRAHHFAFLVTHGCATRLCVFRVAQACDLFARTGHRQAPLVGQLQGLQQRAHLVSRRPATGCHAQQRRRLAAVCHRPGRWRAQAPDPVQQH